MDQERKAVSVRPIQGEIAVASSIEIIGAGNDFTLIFQRNRPARLTTVENQQDELGSIQEASSIVTLSPQTIKDLYLLIGTAVAQYEKDFGVISTPYMRARKTFEK